MGAEHVVGSKSVRPPRRGFSGEYLKSRVIAGSVGAKSCSSAHIWAGSLCMIQKLGWSPSGQLLSMGPGCPCSAAGLLARLALRCVDNGLRQRFYTEHYI